MAFILPILAGIGIGTAVGTVSNPLQVATNKALPVLPQNPNMLVNNLFRGNISMETYLEEMTANGFNKDNAELIADGQQQLLNAQEYLILFRRGLLGESQTLNKNNYLAKMKQIGFTHEVAELFITSQDVLETPQQIITFLVREVLNPELRQILELDNEFPETSLEDFARIGIPEKLARRIWAAHWALPDVTTLTTAYHRYSKQNRKFWEKEVTDQGLNPDKVETSIEDISQLLKFQDVGPHYREQVLSTLFNDAGQIQLRWLIRFRFLKYDEAVYRHERQGLPKALAEQITKVVFVVQSITDWKTGIEKGSITFDDVLKELEEWHITEENIINIVKLKVADDIASGVEEERKLTKSIILDSYDLGKSSRSETIEALKGINYSDDQAKFIMEVHDADIALKKEKEALRGNVTAGEIKKGFREGTLTENQAIDKLVEIGKQKDAAKLIIQIEKDALGKQSK